MIEVLLTNGDSAEAETPEEAVYAARTLMDEAAAHGAASRLLRAAFFVDGKIVRADVRRANLTGGTL